jgi:hypothetical protein
MLFIFADVFATLLHRFRCSTWVVEMSIAVYHYHFWIVWLPIGFPNIAMDDLS